MSSKHLFLQPVPEYQVIESPSSIYVLSQVKFFCLVKGPHEEESSHFDITQHTILSTHSRLSDELGTIVTALRCGRGLLDLKKKIQSSESGNRISLGKLYYINKYITNVNPCGRDLFENNLEKNFSILLKLQFH
jgi:hypothetical protein